MKFSEVKPGDFFVWHDIDIYDGSVVESFVMLKMDCIRPEQPNYNAVNLHNGVPAKFEHDDSVARLIDFDPHSLL